MKSVRPMKFEPSQCYLSFKMLVKFTWFNVGLNLFICCVSITIFMILISVTVSCGLPKPPTNGAMDVQGHLYNETTKIKCNPLYELQGDNLTICQANGRWSPYNTTCVRKLC